MPTAAADTMLRYAGVRESHGYNRSKEIDRFNARAGVPLGSSYCMATVFYAFDVAAVALGCQNLLSRTASCAAQLRHAKQIGSGLQVIPISRIKGGTFRLRKGDVLIHRRGGGSEQEIGRMWAGHAGIALEQIGSDAKSVEANTSSGQRGSQRNGDGVYVRTRAVNWWLAVIRVPT